MRDSFKQSTICLLTSLALSDHVRQVHVAYCMSVISCYHIMRDRFMWFILCLLSYSRPSWETGSCGLLHVCYLMLSHHERQVHVVYYMSVIQCHHTMRNRFMWSIVCLLFYAITPWETGSCGLLYVCYLMPSHHEKQVHVVYYMSVILCYHTMKNRFMWSIVCLLSYAITSWETGSCGLLYVCYPMLSHPRDRFMGSIVCLSSYAYKPWDIGRFVFSTVCLFSCANTQWETGSGSLLYVCSLLLCCHVMRNRFRLSTVCLFSSLVLSRHEKQV